jgi:capsid protein
MVDWRELGEWYPGPGQSDGNSQAEVDVSSPPVISVDDMNYSAGAVTPPAPEYGWWAGDKYHGGFGPTQIFEMDYWELRQRSSQLYRENIYARGIIRRIITNEINTGLTLEAIPDGDILGIDDETLADWSENVENRFAIWARNPKLCDVEERRTYGQLQREIRQEALVAGDILVMLDISRVTGLPKMRTVNGANVQNPADESVVPDSNTVEHGVERNKDGKSAWMTCAVSLCYPSFCNR